MDAAEEPGGRALISRHPISHRLLLHEAFRGVVHSLWAACGSRLQVAHFELREAPPEQPPGSGAAGGTPAPGGSADTAAAAGGAGTGAPDAAGQFSALAFWEQLLAGRHAAAQAASAAALGKGKRQRRKLLDLRADAALDALLRGASSSDGSSEGGGGRSGRSGRSSNASGASAGPGLGGRLLDPRPALLPFLMRFRWSTRWSTRAVPWLSRSEGCTVPSPYPDACLVCGHTCPPPPPPSLQTRSTRSVLRRRRSIGQRRNRRRQSGSRTASCQRSGRGAAERAGHCRWSRGRQQRQQHRARWGRRAGQGRQLPRAVSSSCRQRSRRCSSPACVR